MEQGEAADIEIAFEVGGDVLEADDQGAETRIPMSVVAEMAYEEQLVAWWADASIASRSLRRYSQAQATIKKGDKGATIELPAD